MIGYMDEKRKKFSVGIEYKKKGCPYSYEQPFCTLLISGIAIIKTDYCLIEIFHYCFQFH